MVEKVTLRCIICPGSLLIVEHDDMQVSTEEIPNSVEPEDFLKSKEQYYVSQGFVPDYNRMYADMSLMVLKMYKSTKG